MLQLVRNEIIQNSKGEINARHPTYSIYQNIFQNIAAYFSIQDKEITDLGPLVASFSNTAL